ncbi:MAG: DinB family protein, partial [Bacteroidota bacterium]
VRQVIHHVSESHMNGFIRFKWALTEDIPTIKAYHEDQWALFADDESMPVEIGLSLIEALHQKWVYLLESFTETEWNKSYFHPEDEKRYQLRESLLVYQWHSKHHLAHITTLKERNQW